MKKFSLLMITGLMFAGLVGCKKDYTCECKYKITAIALDTTISYTYEGVKKSDAEASCEASDAALKSNALYSGSSCALK